MVSRMSRKLTSVFVALFLVDVMLFSSWLLASCGSVKSNPIPSPTIKNPPFRSLVAVDIEIDTPPLYSLGHEVALAVANKIDDMASRIHSSGMVIFLCRISSRSFEDCPVSFETPAIPAFVLPPQVPHCGNDPYACSQLKQGYKKAFADWQVLHARQVNNLAAVRAWVHHQTDKIRSMSFPFDDKGSDIFGALATASANFQGLGTDVQKYLLLATDFVSTTTMQENGSFSLAGVSVSAIYRTCSDNAYCQQSNAYWSNVVRSAGAVSFTSYSVSQSEAFGLQLPELPD